MTRLRILVSRFIGLFRKARLEQELDEEVRSHLEMLREENLRKGMSPEEAHYAALRCFGGVEQTKERYRDQRGLPSIESFFQDFRYGLRGLRKNPGFTAVAVLTLALGIGANTAIFSVLNALVLRPLPVQDPSRLVAIYRVNRDGRWTGITVPQIEVIQRQQGVLTGIYGRVYPNNSYVEARDAIWPVNLGYVTGEYYPVLGVTPLLGRLITSDDVGPSQGTVAPVAVLSFDFWQRRYAGSRDAIGKSIVIAGERFTIIGVTPKGFFGELVGFSVDITLPITEQVGRASGSREPLWCQYAIGRLRDGVAIGQARAQLEALWPAIRSETVRASGALQEREEIRSAQIRVDPYPRNGFSYLREQFSKPLYILVATAGLVLLIACANLASLLFARASARQPEMAIRIALGAGRWHLMRQLLTETLLLSACGATVGLGFAYWASGLLVTFWRHIPFNPTTVLDVSPDLRVLGFAIGIALLTGVLSGLAPAWHASHQSPARNMQEVSRGSGRDFRRFGKVIITAQVALSLALATTGGLLVRSFENLRALDPGFHYRNVVFLQLWYKPGPVTPKESYCRALVQQLSSLPGVRSVALSHMLPAVGFGGSQTVAQSDTRSAIGVDADFQIVSPEYFKTLDIPLLRGRDFRQQDNERSPRVAVVSKSLARRLFPSGDAVGKYIHIGKNPQPQEVEVVGVVSDARIRDIQKPWPYIVYAPYFQEPEFTSHWTNVEVLVANDSPALIRRAEEQVDSLGREYVLLSGPLEQLIDTGLAGQRAMAYVAGFFTGLALLLAAIGLYGLMSYTVTQRTREIGIRMALGARRGSVLWIVLREALLLVVVGLAIGLPITIAAGRLVGHMLFGLSPGDPATLAMVIWALAATGILACYIPARRAVKIDPMTALRYE